MVLKHSTHNTLLNKRVVHKVVCNIPESVDLIETPTLVTVDTVHPICFMHIPKPVMQGADYGLRTCYCVG